jgi:hypothetical protein
MIPDHGFSSGEFLSLECPVFFPSHSLGYAEICCLKDVCPGFQRLGRFFPIIPGNPRSKKKRYLH